MTTPLPLDTRPHGSIWRHAEVMKAPINYLASYPEGAHNPHDELQDDIFCRLCSSNGNIQLADPLQDYDGALSDAPSSRDDDSVPYQIFTFGSGGKLEPFYMEEQVVGTPAAAEQATLDVDVASLMRAKRRGRCLQCRRHRLRL